jgi:hypothetical protein
MRVATRFAAKFADSIVATLSCVDRLIFKGYLPFGGDQELNRFVDRLGIRRKDFLPQLLPWSERLIEHAKSAAARQGAPYQYLQGQHSKEKLIDQVIRERKLTRGLIAVLCCIENCRTVKLRHGEGKPHLAFTRRPQRVVYYYFLDPEFGRIHVRIETWFPFTIQIYVHGHDWLAQQLAKRRLGFLQRDNCFLELDEPAAAQRQADRFFSLAWKSRLNRWAKQVNPLLKEVSWLRPMEYRWVIDQFEYSTDVLFRSRQHLAELYPRLLDHAAVHFSAQDILTFLGRKLHPRFAGEVLTHAQKDRLPGARVKHRMKNNWLKMYDKFGQVLRVETVINNPREFQVRRRRKRRGRWKRVWCPMNKGIANLYQYQNAAHAANVRYLEALSVVKDPTPAYQHVAALVQPKQEGQRSFAGFNPARRDDVQFFHAVLRGEHDLKGFRNAHLRRLLQIDHCDPADRQRARAAIGRRLKRLHVRGLIAKIPHTRRWKVTPLGHRTLGACIQLYYHGLVTAA